MKQLFKQNWIRFPLIWKKQTKKSINRSFVCHLPWSAAAPLQHREPWCECKWIWRTTLASSRAAGEGSPLYTAPQCPRGPAANGRNGSPAAPEAQEEKRGWCSDDLGGQNKITKVEFSTEVKWCGGIPSPPPTLCWGSSGLPSPCCRKVC